MIGCFHLYVDNAPLPSNINGFVCKIKVCKELFVYVLSFINLSNAASIFYVVFFVFFFVRCWKYAIFFEPDHLQPMCVCDAIRGTAIIVMNGVAIWFCLVYRFRERIKLLDLLNVCVCARAHVHENMECWPIRLRRKMNFFFDVFSSTRF